MIGGARRHRRANYTTEIKQCNVDTPEYLQNCEKKNLKLVFHQIYELENNVSIYSVMQTK
jgi:hypothetical protein